LILDIDSLPVNVDTFKVNQDLLSYKFLDKFNNFVNSTRIDQIGEYISVDPWDDYTKYFDKAQCSLIEELKEDMIGNFMVNPVIFALAIACQLKPDPWSIDYMKQDEEETGFTEDDKKRFNVYLNKLEKSFENFNNFEEGRLTDIIPFRTMSHPWYFDENGKPVNSEYLESDKDD